jgi:uncharacterized protein
MSANFIDPFKVSRLAERLEGETPIAAMERLAEAAHDKVGNISWVVQGGIDRFDYPQLSLHVTGAVNLLCQRCLTPLRFEIDSQALLVLAKDEARADEIEAQLADDAIDVIVTSNELNLNDLIEDEALLSLPFAPKHDVCPDATALTDLVKNDKASPFAVLKNLK